MSTTAKEVAFEGTIRFPDGEQFEYCGARVVNLDLNSPLLGKSDGSRVKFDELLWIKKLGQIHSDPIKREWSLCWTLHGEIKWDVKTADHVQQFLKDKR